MDPVVNSTNASPATPATKLPVIPTVDAFALAVKDLSNDDLCVEFTRELIRRNLIPVIEKRSEKKGVPSTFWGAFDLGTGAGLYKSIDLTPVQSRRLNMQHGVPMALGLRATVLDLTPQPQAEARRKERQVQTATRESNKADSVSTSALLDALNRRRAAEGREPLK
jgi:hypothetical protein